MNSKWNWTYMIFVFRWTELSYRSIARVRIWLHQQNARRSCDDAFDQRIQRKQKQQASIWIFLCLCVSRWRCFYLLEFVMLYEKSCLCILLIDSRILPIFRVTVRHAAWPQLSRLVASSSSTTWIASTASWTRCWCVEPFVCCRSLVSNVNLSVCDCRALL